jgi:methylated-DNA-[protein]-cysteine S-methyltransferase
MLAVASESALLYLDFIDEKVETQNSNNPILLKLEQELRDYFVKKLRTFSIPLSPSGTAFQRAVWDTLLKIPYGLTLSYADEAKLFGNPKATRAVANANGKNPISILIPCHRVISSDGSIGGYSGGGIWRKEFLLSLEGVEK